MTRDPASCGGVRDLLAELIYGELDEATASRVREHIDRCEACRAELDELERVRAVMRSTRELDLPAGLEARVMSEARSAMGERDRSDAAAPDRESPGGLSALIGRLMAPRVLRPALAAALTALIVAGIAYLVADRRGSVVERYAERPSREVARGVVAPAAPPATATLETGKQGGGEAREEPAPPPYPSEASGKIPLRDEEAKHARSEESTDGVATGKPELLANIEDMTTTGAAKSTEGESLAKDLDEMAGGGKAEASGAAGPTDAMKAGSAVPEAGLGISTGGFAVEVQPPAAEKSVPAPSPAGPPPPPKGAAQSMPAPATPSFAAADDEEQEQVLLEAGESGAVSKSETKEDKKTWWEKYKERKAEKKAKKKPQAEAPKKKAPAEPAATLDQPAEQKAADPFDEAKQLAKKKDHAAAIAILASLKKNPSSTQASPAEVLHLLASCTASAGDTARALVYYENLLAGHPGYAGRHRAMWEAANLYIKSGDKTRARELLEKLTAVEAWAEKAKKKLEQLD